MRASWHEGSLTALEEEWTDLFQADSRATPFSAFAWARAWSAHWEPGADLRIATVRDDGGKLAGLAPLVLYRRGPFRVLRVLGEHPADYWDVLAEDARREQVTLALGRHLARSKDWEALVLNRLPEGSPTATLLVHAGLTVTGREGTPYPVLRLPATFDEYLGSLGRKPRNLVRRHLRRLDDGALTIGDVRDPEEIDPAVGRWQELRIRQWRELGKDLSPVHAEPRFGALMSDALKALIPADRAVFWEVRSGDEQVGSYINFVDRDRFYHYLGGFDPAHSQLGIGRIVTAQGIRSSIESGRRSYDFLMGAEPYKYWYGAEDYMCPFLLVSPGHPRARVARAVSSAAHRVRHVRGGT